MRGAEIGKVYSHTSLVFWSLFMFLIYCHSHWNQHTKKQHNMDCSFHNIKRRGQRSINMAKATPYKSNITYITIRFLWTAMNLLWLFKRISVARVSGENISNSWQACNRSPARTCNFWAPSSSNTRSNWHIDSITSSALFLKQTLHYHTSELRTELTNSYTLKQQKKCTTGWKYLHLVKIFSFLTNRATRVLEPQGREHFLSASQLKEKRSMWKQFTWTEFLRHTQLQYLDKVHTSYSCKILFNTIHPPTSYLPIGQSFYTIILYILISWSELQTKHIIHYINNVRWAMSLTMLCQYVIPHTFQSLCVFTISGFWDAQ